MPVNGRQAALSALQSWRKNGAWSDSALNAALEKVTDAREAALASRIAYGVVQNAALCDHTITHYLTHSRNRIEPVVLDILRMGAYQILLMDKIPPSAAVNESVCLCRERGYARASGLVNAVLRRIAEGGIPPIETGSAVSDMAVRYSHPEWMVRRLCDLIGMDETESLLQADNAQTPISCRVNTLKTTQSELFAKLRELGLEPRSTGVPNGFTLDRGGDLRKCPSFMQGEFYVQDAAAALAVLAADPKPGQTVLDACAAPGGKTFTAAVQMKNKGRIIACDLYDARLSLVEQGAQRLGISIAETLCTDSTQFIPQWEETFDTVLADVPCSGLGVIRKKPEIRYKPQEQIVALPALQLGILKNVSRYVKPGGTLVYSTCTVLPEENEEVVGTFLRTAPFETEAFSLPKPVGDVPMGMVTLWPQRHGTDGFFICRLKKRS